MSLAVNYGFSPGVAVLAFLGLVIGSIIVLIAVLKVISVISNSISDARVRRHLARRPSSGPAMRPGEGFSDVDGREGWEPGGFFDRGR